MCFAPQRRALFHHLSFQKCRATTACTFSTSKLPSVVRPWKYASRHNGVQCFIFHLASWLRTRHFSEPTFRPSGATNHWKNTVFRDFPTFSRTWIFFLLRLSLTSLLSSDSSHLCFSSVHIVGSLTSIDNGHLEGSIPHFQTQYISTNILVTLVGSQYLFTLW